MGRKGRMGNGWVKLSQGRQNRPYRGMIHTGGSVSVGLCEDGWLEEEEGRVGGKKKGPIITTTRPEYITTTKAVITIIIIIQTKGIYHYHCDHHFLCFYFLMYIKKKSNTAKNCVLSVNTSKCYNERVHHCHHLHHPPTV